MHLLLFLIASPAHPPVDGTQLLEEVRRSKPPLVLVNAWATWCKPCVEELPVLAAIQRRFPKRVRVILVSTDFAKERPAARALLRKKRIRLPNLFKAGKDQPFIDALHPDWNGTLPATVLFDRSGRRLKLFQGAVTEARLIAAIEKQLASSTER